LIEARQERAATRKRAFHSRFRTYLPYVLSGAALVIFGAYLYRNADRYRGLLDFSFASLLLLLGLVLLLPAANGLINFLLYRSLGAPLPFGEALGLAAVNTLANQLPLAGGLVAKGLYLKQRHNLPYSRFLSATAALYVCFVSANGVVGLAVISLLTARGTTVPLLLTLGFGLMTASILLLGIRVDFVSGKWRERLGHLIEGWKTLSHNRTLLLKLVAVQIATTVAAAWRFWITFHSLSQEVTYAQCLLFSSATILTRLVSVAPGGLGVREGIVAGMASLLGFEAGVSAVAVGIDRLVATSLIIVLGTIYTHVLSARATGVTQVDGTLAEE
jgi:uncharacterized membrane protein YbhN (UPF0104 family)